MRSFTLLLLVLASCAAQNREYTIYPFNIFHSAPFFQQQSTLVVRGSADSGPGFEHVVDIRDNRNNTVFKVEINYKTMTVTHKLWPIFENTAATSGPVTVAKTLNRTTSVYKDFNIRIRPISPNNCGFVLYESWQRIEFPCHISPPRDYSNSIDRFLLYCNNNCTNDVIKVLPSIPLPLQTPLPYNSMVSNVSNSVVFTAAAVGDFTVDIANAQYPNDINFRLNCKFNKTTDNNRKIHLNYYKNGEWGSVVLTNLTMPTGVLHNIAIIHTQNYLLIQSKPLATAVVNSWTFPHKASDIVKGYQQLIVKGALEIHNLHFDIKTASN